MHIGRALRVLGVLMVLQLGVRSALAEDVWRLAGTFNGWNLADAAWTMSPDARLPGRVVLDRAMAPGSYKFKFVKNGAWAQGHLGAGANSPTALEQPGADIPLRIRVAADYRFVLNPGARMWSLEPRVSETRLDVRTVGPFVKDRPFLIDLSRTLSVKRLERTMVSFEYSADMGVKPLDETGLRYQAIPTVLGPSWIDVRVNDGGKVSTARSEFDVWRESEVKWATAHNRSRVLTATLESQGDGVERALVRFADRTDLGVVEVIPAEGEIVRAQGMTVPAGTYAVEVKDGAVVTRDDPGLPLVLIPGNWKRLAYRPSRPVDTVHMIGDFNDWARPGQPGALELLARPDGTYSATVDLPRGAMRYKFLLDGEEEVLDPNAKSSDASSRGGATSVMMVGPLPAEYAKAEPNAINQAAVRHTSTGRDFVAISSALGLADVALSTLPGDVERVVLNLEVQGPGGKTAKAAPLARSQDAAGFDRWTGRIMTGGPPGTGAAYTFTLTDGSATWQTARYSSAIAPKLEHPAWAMGAAWYQIFPERFRNGNSLNDPSGPGVHLKPWNDDWYTITPEEDKAWRKRFNIAPGAPYPARKGGDLFHVVWDRRYGGDLQGVAEKFKYLRELGITAIYLNPIFEAESMHKYDATDYRHIDDNLATPAGAGAVGAEFDAPDESEDAKTWKWTPADRYFVDEFLPRAHGAGLRVVIDGVFNHTGKSFFAFKDIEENGEKSAYKDWYICEFDADGKLKTWVSWFNTGSLPKFRQMENGDLVAPVKEMLFGITRRWMDPNGDGDPSDGIDGWRLDVALDVGLPFWRDWRGLVKGINPDAIIIAEIWDDASSVLNGDTFDTQMHYPFSKPVLDWLGMKPGYTSAQLAAALGPAFDDLAQTNLIHQNLFGSHDTDRFASMLLNPGREYDQGNRLQDHEYPYKDVRPSPEVYKRSLLGVAMQALYTGAPMIYYGDEVGMWGADDPTDRKPFPWPDKGGMKNKDENPDWDLHKQYTHWLGLRSDSAIGPILRYGAVRHLDSGDPDVFAFERSLNGKRVVAVINRGERPYNAAKFLPGGARGGVAEVSARYWVGE